MIKRKAQQPSVTESIKAFLRGRGAAGASLEEIYSAVRADLGKGVLDSSIRSILYKRLVTAHSAYLPAFERFRVKGKNRYRIISESRGRRERLLHRGV